MRGNLKKDYIFAKFYLLLTQKKIENFQNFKVEDKKTPIMKKKILTTNNKKILTTSLLVILAATSPNATM